MQTASIDRNAVFAFCILHLALTGSAPLLFSPALAEAQLPSDCPAVPCASPERVIAPGYQRLWSEAAAVHTIKLEFVAALQRFVRAQAGTFGNEAAELADSLASMRAALRRWDDSIQQFRSDAGRLPAGAEIHVAVATVLLDRHLIEPALRELGEAEQFDGDRLDVHRLRALAHGLAGRSGEAARALRTAGSIDAGDPTLFYALARHAMRLNRADDAADAFRSFQRAILRRAKAGESGPGSPFERVDLLRQPAGVAPVFPIAQYADGFAALHAGDYATALTRFDEAVALDPMLAGDDEVRRRAAEGAAALRRGNLPAALATLQAAVAAVPAHAESHRILGLAYWIDGRNGVGIEQLRAAIARAPGDERARVALADILVEEGRASEAERELRQALDAGIRSGQIHDRLAQLYRRQGRLPEAVDELQAAERFGPVVGRDRFYQMLGSIRVDRADFEGAVAAYSQRVEINPNHGEAHRQLGEIYFLQGRHPEALAEFSAASWLDPQDARAHAATGQLHVRMLNYGEAVVALRRALSIDPYQREARYALGTSLMRLGKVEEGRAELESFQRQQAAGEAAGQREFQLEALRREASRNLNAGAVERAIGLFAEVLAADTASARSHRDLGLALLRARLPLDAIPHLEAAQRTDGSSDGFRSLAEAYAAVGNREAGSRQMDLYRAAVEQAKRERIRRLSGEPAATSR
jgi:tetratricopeptide (TPR) repeat protein